MWQDINNNIVKKSLVLKSKMPDFGTGDTNLIWTVNENNEVILTKFSVEGEDVIYHNAETGEPVVNIVKMHNYPNKPEPPLAEGMDYIELIKYMKNLSVKRQQFEIAAHIRDFEKKLLEIIT